MLHVKQHAGINGSMLADFNFSPKDEDNDEKLLEALCFAFAMSTRDESSMWLVCVDHETVLHLENGQKIRNNTERQSTEGKRIEEKILRMLDMLFNIHRVVEG